MTTVPGPWPVVDVSSWTDAGVEPDGRQRHNWLTDVSRERAWLFKPIRAGRESRPLGEHLVEKLASEIVRHFGIPAARVELARRGATPGCIVEDVSLRKGSMFPGRALMLEVVDDYDSEDPEHQGHTVANIRRALEPLAAPPDTPTPEAFGAFDVFTGYLVFDALIANGDRHDGNGAVLRRPPGQHGADMLCFLRSRQQPWVQLVRQGTQTSVGRADCGLMGSARRSATVRASPRWPTRDVDRTRTIRHRALLISGARALAKGDLVSAA